MNRFELENENQEYKLNGRRISTKYKNEQLWGTWYYDTEEEAKKVFEELKKMVGNRCREEQYDKRD